MKTLLHPRFSILAVTLAALPQLSALHPLRAGKRAGVRCPFVRSQPSTFKPQLVACLLAAIALTSDVCPVTSGASAATVTFTSNVTISETDLAYEGQDIIVSGATLTADGPHAFNFLLPAPLDLELPGKKLVKP
jgi:hypothetical protein